MSINSRTWRFLGMAGAAAVTFVAVPVFADDDEPKDETKSEDTSDTNAETKAEATATVSTKGKSLSSTTEADSDHAQYVGAFAIGYLGASEIPFVQNAAVVPGQVITMNATATTLNAPVIGMRYWLSDLLGLDVGIGLRSYGGTITRHFADMTNTVEQDVDEKKVNGFGMLIHAGVPLALHAEKHWTFEVIPELNVGFSSGTIQDPNKGAYVPPGSTPIYTNDIKLSGLRFDVGARAGTELHFGFIGVPNLSLQATVGLYFRYDKIKAKGGGNPDPNASTPDTAYQESTVTWGTSVQDAPWSIFTKNVSALYYF